jgi:hypothetical protein
MIKTQTYPINNLPITSELLTSFINSFWREIFNSLRDTNHLYLLCKVQFADQKVGYRTLGHLRKVNFEDKELFIDYLIQRLGLLTESYMVHAISNITFSYVIKEGRCNDSNRALLNNLEDKVSTNHTFNNMQLPISMNPKDYGKIEVFNEIDENGLIFYRYIVTNGSRTYRIDMFERSSVVTILGNIDLSWTDTRIDRSLDTFMREIKKSTIYFMDGEVVLRK